MAKNEKLKRMAAKVSGGGSYHKNKHNTVSGGGYILDKTKNPGRKGYKGLYMAEGKDFDVKKSMDYKAYKHLEKKAQYKK